jgi:hypothetical protein
LANLVRREMKELVKREEMARRWEVIQEIFRHSDPRVTQDCYVVVKSGTASPGSFGRKIRSPNHKPPLLEPQSRGSSVVEQPIRNRQVVGSTPTLGSTLPVYGPKTSFTKRSEYILYVASVGGRNTRFENIRWSLPV